MWWWDGGQGINRYKCLITKRVCQEPGWPFIPGIRMVSIFRLFRSGMIMVSIMIVALIYLKIERKNILSSQSQLELTHHGTVEIPMETFKKKPILIEPDERRYHINSTKVKDFNPMSLLNYRNNQKVIFVEKAVLVLSSFLILI